MQGQDRHFYEFGPFHLDPNERLLLRQGEVVPLAPKAFETLLVLVEHHGHVLCKDELMKIIWPDTIVEEGNLTQHIFTLRRVLGEGHGEQHYIETIPRRGYRFVAGVKDDWDKRTELIVEEHTHSNVTNEDQEETGALVPSPLKRMVSVSGELNRKFRWKTGKRALAVSGLLAGLVVALFYFWGARLSNKPVPGAGLRSLAVLPFKEIGAEGDDPYLGLGMADVLITRLGSLRQVVVRPTNSVSRYTSPGRDPRVAGQELGVDAVLDGNIQRSGDRLRLTVQLVGVRDGARLWSEKFDEKFTDILAVQDAISEKVAEALMLQLTGEQRKLLQRRYTENVEAHQAYLMGRYFWDRRHGKSLFKAIEYFQQAINLDPNYALAHAGLADCYVSMSGGTLQLSAGNRVKASTAATRALDLDDTLAEAHTSLASLRLQEWDWSGAGKEFERAIELNPNYANAHLFYAWYLQLRGRVDEGLAEIYRARDLDPLSIAINTTLGRMLIETHQYDRAIEHLQKALELGPDVLWPRLRLAQAYTLKGMYDQAFAEYQKAIGQLRDEGNREVVSVARLRLGPALALAGKKDEAISIINDWKKNPDPLMRSEIAIIHLCLGNKDEAFVLWHQACADRDGGLLYAILDPRLDGIRSDTRYIDLLRCMGLAP
ncbi:MAG: winged helix-turn-helix domain-containing protein [Acidobacteria bacterium]|nr:winged helix-turn-helix domain-containing protein [Acidobacteriota bacterium]